MQKEEQCIQYLTAENSTSRTVFLSGFGKHFKNLGCVAGVTGNISFPLRRPHKHYIVLLKNMDLRPHLVK